MSLKDKKLISWEVLDRCKSADEIYRLLLKNRIVGKRYQEDMCPLAVATGYSVGAMYRWEKYSNNLENLTCSESTFVARFDLEYYPDLIRKVF